MCRHCNKSRKVVRPPGERLKNMLKKALILTTALAYVASVPAMAATTASVAAKSTISSSHASLGAVTKVADAAAPADDGAKKKTKKKKKKKAAPAAG